MQWNESIWLGSVDVLAYATIDCSYTAHCLCDCWCCSYELLLWLINYRIDRLKIGFCGNLSERIELHHRSKCIECRMNLQWTCVVNKFIGQSNGNIWCSVGLIKTAYDSRLLCINTTRWMQQHSSRRKINWKESQSVFSHSIRNCRWWKMTREKWTCDWYYLPMNATIYESRNPFRRKWSRWLYSISLIRRHAHRCLNAPV